MSHTHHQEGLLRHSAVLLVATQIGNVCTMLFQILMMRRLSVVEYGVLASMLSLVLITGTPLEALRTAVAHRTALLMRLNRAHAIRPFLYGWVLRLALAAAVILIIGLSLNHWLASFFQLTTRWPVVLTICIIAASLFMPLFAGGLQGVQAFTWMAAHAQMWPVFRFVAALVLTWSMGQTAMAGLTAQSMAVLVSIGFGLFAWHKVIAAGHGNSESGFAQSNYFIYSLLSLAGYAVLMNADVSLVKRFFAPDQAGIFAQAATIARSVVFLPMPIAVVMFPKVVSLGHSSGVDKQILLRAVLLTAMLIVLSASFCSLGADIIWRIFTGDTLDAETRLMVRWIIWAMAPLGLTYLLMNFEIAQGRFRGPLTLLLLAATYVTGVSLWHASFTQVLTVMTTVSLLSLSVMLLDVFRSVRRSA